jgi:ankyrin repeat protein
MGSSFFVQSTAMHAAAFYDRLQVVRLLRERPEIDLALLNSMGETALTVAMAAGRRQIVELLNPGPHP